MILTRQSFINYRGSLKRKSAINPLPMWMKSNMEGGKKSETHSEKLKDGFIQIAGEK
nr:MAG TPA_asm: hypothetical protein [Caudoviricetes sp.]